MLNNVNTVPDYENLSVLHKNTLPPRAYFIPFANLEESKKSKVSYDYSGSSRYFLLSGKWDFKYYSSVFDVEENIEKIIPEGLSTIDVPSCWQMTGFERPHYLNHRFAIPAIPPRVPNDNPVGVYKKVFEIPNNFEGKKVVISFLGVVSAFHLYLNSKEIGYSQGSHNSSEFDITDFLVSGKNILTVVVYKWCDGTYLEDQDHFRSNGIFRDVYLTALDKSYIFDFKFSYAKSGDDFKVNLDLITKGKPCKTNIILEKDGEIIYNGDGPCFDVKNPKLWTAEIPELYTLYLQLTDGGKEVECVKCNVGFKDITIENGVFKINGAPVKFKGVNRHDSNPVTGYTVSMSDMENDIVLLKNYNVNMIRTSHYPNDPRFLELCDKYGIFIVDEADIECHGAIEMGHWNYFQENAEWLPAFWDRVEKMYYRDRNHICVTMWSMGNESGAGPNHRTCYDRLKALDPKTPIHYEGENNFPGRYFDVDSYMYLHSKSVEERCNNDDNRPVFLCEYSHGMGLSPGGMEDYWQVFYNNERACGGCVWEFADHLVLSQDENGKTQIWAPAAFRSANLY